MRIAWYSFSPSHILENEGELAQASNYKTHGSQKPAYQKQSPSRQHFLIICPVPGCRICSSFVLCQSDADHHLCHTKGHSDFNGQWWSRCQIMSGSVFAIMVSQFSPPTSW